MAEQYKTRKVDKNKVVKFGTIHMPEEWNKGPYYNQAFLFTAYLVHILGKERFRRFIFNLLSAIGTNSSFEAFCNYFRNCFQLDFKTVESNWLEQLEK